jgi:hypothetical protein
LNRSKRRSARRRVSSNPPQLEIFCDRSLGRRKVPDRLRQIHPAVLAHDDLFPQDVDDEVWLRAAGERGWIVLTKDERIRYRPGEQRAIVEAGVRCFCLHPTKGMTGDDMAEVLARALPRILRIAAADAGGYVKVVNRTGRIRDVYP